LKAAKYARFEPFASAFSHPGMEIIAHDRKQPIMFFLNVGSTLIFRQKPRGSMKFNPIKRILYTDKGEIIKKLNCPYKVAFSEPAIDSSNDEHTCDICNGQIIDTNGYEDEALLQLSKNINLCFKVDATQPNLRIVYIQ
jgi:hypothetical protein